MLAVTLLATVLADRPVAQTDWQKNKVNEIAQRAGAFDKQGYKEVIEYINSPRFKLAVNGTPLATRSPTDIAEWFMANLQLTPLTHTFEVADLETVRQLGFAPNIWEMMRLGKAKFSKGQDTAEVKLMGYPEFANKTFPSNDEAINRPQYLSLNIWRGMNGQYFYGEVTLVFNPKYVDRLILAPVDTGGYTQDCIMKSPSDIGSGAGPNCSAWQRDNNPWGVWKAMWHMVLRHCEYYNYKLSDLMLHMLGREETDGWYYRHYYEADIMGHFLLPETLLYIVANHSQIGNQIFHDVARQVNRPLMWAGEYTIMIVDPFVGMIAGEYQIQQKDKDAFLPLWTRKAPWADMIKAVAPDLQLRALRVDSCTTEKSTDFKGGDFAQIPGSSTDECCRTCDHNAGCMAWTYDANKHVCLLKNANYQRAKAAESMTSAVRSACIPVDGRYYIGQNKNHKCLYQ